MLFLISQHIKIPSEYSCVLDTENKRYLQMGLSSFATYFHSKFIRRIE